MLVLVVAVAVLILLHDRVRVDDPGPTPESPPPTADRLPDTVAATDSATPSESRPADRAITLRGRVITPDRNPVSGAQVVVRGRDGREFRSLTGSDGVYLVKGGAPTDRVEIELSLHVTHESGAAARTRTVSPGQPNM